MSSRQLPHVFREDTRDTPSAERRPPNSVQLLRIIKEFLYWFGGVVVLFSVLMLFLVHWSDQEFYAIFPWSSSICLVSLYYAYYLKTGWLKNGFLVIAGFLLAFSSISLVEYLNR